MLCKRATSKCSPSTEVGNKINILLAKIPLQHTVLMVI